MNTVGTILYMHGCTISDQDVDLELLNAKYKLKQRNIDFKSLDGDIIVPGAHTDYAADELEESVSGRRYEACQLIFIDNSRNGWLDNYIDYASASNEETAG